jgi:PAS domain S-box-containing protein
MGVWLLAQDVLGGAAGWSSFGIAGLVLGWLLLKRLPDNDRQLEKLLGDKDRQIKEMAAVHTAAAEKAALAQAAAAEKAAQAHSDAIRDMAKAHAEEVKEVVKNCQEDSRRQQEASERRHFEQMALLSKIHEVGREGVHATRNLADRMGLAQRLADALQSTEAPVWTKTLDGTLLSWNAACERVLGWKQGEVVGKSIFHRIIPPDRTQEEEQILLRISRGEIVPEYQTERKSRNGRLVPLMVVTSPIRDQSGKVVGASTIAHEIEGE